MLPESIWFALAATEARQLLAIGERKLYSRNGLGKLQSVTVRVVGPRLLRVCVRPYTQQ